MSSRALAVALGLALSLAAFAAAADDDPRRAGPVRRQGVFLGMDPGLSLRFDESGVPIYARLDFRVGGCLSPRVHLGADWRADLLVGGVAGAPPSRHEIGPVIAFFLVEGWFVRAFAHVARVNPFTAVLGGQSGYEWTMDRFTAIGFALGGDAEFATEGHPLAAWSISAGFYLSAYDLGTRSGRDEGGY
jgi:hypothetical protein